MKTKHILIVIALLLCGQGYAQSGRKVYGTIIDSSKLSVRYGTIKLVSETRDSMVTTADSGGHFNFEQVKGNHLTVTIHSIGYIRLTKHYLLQDVDTDLGNIVLKAEKPMLQTLSIAKPQAVTLHIDTDDYQAQPYKIHETAPINDLINIRPRVDVDSNGNITLPKEKHAMGIDTLDYLAYKMRKNAQIDSVLKRIPQDDVDSNGNITYHDQVVTKVRIDGKNYLGGNVETTVKNLPPDIVEKIQVIDDYGVQADVGEGIINNIPVVYKEDTIMYNVANYKTGGKGKLVDLLKKLPGVEVDAEGNILIQGNTVIRVSVDGKPYSDNKLKRAMKNMPADLISKVLVIDDYFNSANYSGFKPWPEKVIDIITKKQ